jgi:hypothetical protein
LTCFAEHHKISDASQFRLRARTQLAAPSFNGRTADSGSAYRGSNPWGAANQPLLQNSKKASHLKTLPPFWYKTLDSLSIQLNQQFADANEV